MNMYMKVQAYKSRTKVWLNDVSYIVTYNIPSVIFIQKEELKNYCIKYLNILL